VVVDHLMVYLDPSLFRDPDWYVCETLAVLVAQAAAGTKDRKLARRWAKQRYPHLRRWTPDA
jgi:hypothetical protein